jgi:Protein of unknown function (DUF4197)
MTDIIGRRTLLATATLAPLLALSGCATTGGFDLTEAIRRLLGLSAQRALASLMAENGFFDSQVTRISLPPQLGGGQATSILGAILQSTAFRDRLSRSLNRAAEKGAALAAPVVTDVIQGMPIRDVVSIVRGGPTAATMLLQGALGQRLVETMLPGIGDGLRLFDSGVVTQALRAATGIDIAGLRADVAQKASDGIYRAIGREEAAIRANPSSTGDPLIAAVFALAR